MRELRKSRFVFQRSGFLKEILKYQSLKQISLMGAGHLFCAHRLKKSCDLANTGRQNTHSASATQLHGHTIRCANVYTKVIDYKEGRPWAAPFYSQWKWCIQLQAQLCGRSAVCILSAGVR